MLNRLPTYEFFFSRWNAGSLHELGLMQRYYDIVSPRGKRLIKEYAIGWQDGNNVPCRPKKNTIAIMFYKDDEYFWTHITIKEFNEVFNDET